MITCLYQNHQSLYIEITEVLHYWMLLWKIRYNDVIKSAMASQITSLTIVYWTVCSEADQIKYQSSSSLAFVRGIHRWPVNSPHKGPVTWKMFPFDDVIIHMKTSWHRHSFRTNGLCRGYPSVEVFTHTGRVIWSFHVSFVNKMVYKPSSCRTFETPWRTCDVTAMSWTVTYLHRESGTRNGIRWS